MSFLHTHSCECTKAELDLFTLPPTQTAIESSQTIEYKPVTSLSDESPIEFVIPGTSEEYIDLTHTMLSVQLKIEKGNAAISEDALVAPVNNFLHSLFSQVDIYFNQKPVSSPNNAYPYRAYIETLLNYSEEAKSSHLTSSLWYNDTPGKVNSVIEKNKDNAVVSANRGAEIRREFIKGGKTLDLIGHLHCDVFNQHKYLLNGVEMRLRLSRSKNSFCLLDFESAACKVHILEASLRVRKAKINPGILLAHSKALSKGTAKYPVTRVEVKTFTLHTGVTGETLDNIIIGQIPKRIIIGLVSNKAFNGDRKENPFYFQHFNLNFLALYIDGVQVPGKALQPDFNSSYIDAYSTLFSGTGIHFMNEGNCISREDYKDGYTLYAFDLTPDLSANCNTHWNLVKQGTVRLQLGFSQSLHLSVNCIVYLEYDNVIEIDSARQVIVDFSA